jgi:hypothetical protein
MRLTGGPGSCRQQVIPYLILAHVEPASKIFHRQKWSAIAEVGVNTQLQSLTKSGPMISKKIRGGSGTLRKRVVTRLLEVDMSSPAAASSRSAKEK